MGLYFIYYLSYTWHTGRMLLIYIDLAWPIHESRRLQMRGAEGEAVLILVKKRVLGLRTIRNKADAAGSARPEPSDRL